MVSEETLSERVERLNAAYLIVSEHRKKAEEEVERLRKALGHMEEAKDDAYRERHEMCGELNSQAEAFRKLHVAVVELYGDQAAALRHAQLKHAEQLDARARELIEARKQKERAEQAAAEGIAKFQRMWNADQQVIRAQSETLAMVDALVAGYFLSSMTPEIRAQVENVQGGMQLLEKVDGVLRELVDVKGLAETRAQGIAELERFKHASHVVLARYRELVHGDDLRIVMICGRCHKYPALDQSLDGEYSGGVGRARVCTYCAVEIGVEASGTEKDKDEVTEAVDFPTDKERNA